MLRGRARGSVAIAQGAGILLGCTAVLVSRGLAAEPRVPTVVEPTTEAEYTVQFAIEPPAEWPAGGEVRLSFDEKPDGTGYLLTVGSQTLSFAKSVGGHAIALGRPGTYVRVPGRLRCVLQRRQSHMLAYLNNDLVATACDGAYHQGAVAWVSTHDALRVADVAVQPTAEVTFNDDFVRENASAEGWQALSGKWETVGPESKSPRPDLSANPFSLRASKTDTEELALTTAGEWFWSDYRAEVAAKATGMGALGLAAYVQDAGNLFLFRWTGTGGPSEGQPAGRKQLIRVRDGRWTVLAESPGGFLPDHWYRLGLSACDGWLEAAIDGKPVIRARDTTFGQGRIGLFAQNLPRAYFDDVRVASAQDFADDFAREDMGWWQPASGEWACRLGHCYCVAGATQVGQALVGEADWRQYEISALAKPKDAGAVGLVACRGGDGRYYAFRWDRSGRQALLFVRPEGETVLAAATAPRDPARFHRLALSVVDGRIAASVDGTDALEAAGLDLVQGQAGLLAQDSSDACFDSVAVTFAPPPSPEFKVTAQFTRETTMENWVDPSHQWRQGDDQTLWYDMPLFGDFTFWLPEMDLSASQGKVEVCLAPEPKRDAAPRLVVSADGKSLSGEVVSGDAVLTKGQIEAAGPGRVRIARRGQCLSVWCGEKPVLACAQDSFRNRRLGLRVEGLPLKANETTLASPNLLDVTFAGAPTDWSPGLGVWQVTDRWPCAPGWSWFGGSGHQSPLLWSKDSFSGDQVVEFWAGLKMDMDHEPGYSHPSDLDATLCGDGEKLCSGYSFVMAGAGNTKSMILKGQQPVAENAQIKFENPVSMNFAFHRHWFDMRIERTGNRFRYTVDDKLVAEWTDPDPLPGGKVAFWSWNNGLLIARARVAAERVTR